MLLNILFRNTRLFLDEKTIFNDPSMRSHGGPGGGQSSELRKAGIIDWYQKGEWDEGEETRDRVTGDYFVAIDDFNGLDTFALEFAAGHWLQIAGPSAVAVEVNDTVFVDASYGNDGLGVREDMSLPFATIEAAVAAANVGDTIHVMPGVYVPVGNLTPKQLDFYFTIGAVVNAVGPVIIFDITTDISVNVTGYGVFTSASQVVRLNAPGGIINFRAEEVESTGHNTFEMLNGVFQIKCHFIRNSDPSNGNAIKVSGTTTGNVVSDIVSKTTDGGHTLHFTGWDEGQVQLHISNLYAPTAGATNFSAIKTDSSNNTSTLLISYGKIMDLRTAISVDITDANSTVWHESGNLKIVGDIETLLYRGFITTSAISGTVLIRGHITSNHIDESVYIGSGVKDVRIYGDIINTDSTGGGTGYAVSIGRTTVTDTIKVGNKLYHKGVCEHRGVIGTENAYFKGGAAPSDTILVLDGGKIISLNESIIPEAATTQDVKVTGFVTSTISPNADINLQISSILVDLLVE